MTQEKNNTIVLQVVCGDPSATCNFHTGLRWGGAKEGLPRPNFQVAWSSWLFECSLVNDCFMINVAMVSSRFLNSDEKANFFGSVQSCVCTPLVCAAVACTGLDFSHKSFRNMIPNILVALICKTIILSLIYCFVFHSSWGIKAIFHDSGKTRQSYSKLFVAISQQH